MLNIKRIKKKLLFPIKKRIYNIKDNTFTGVSNLQRNTSKPVIWLLGTEDYGNLGDHKIAEAEVHFINNYFPDYDLIEISARNYNLQRDNLITLMQPLDIIIGTGGGNFGNQYPESQRIRDDYITLFPNNKIIIMPQTIWFTNDDKGKSALQKTVDLYATHNHLLIVAREKKSYEFVQNHFKNKSILIPDIVLYEKPQILHKNSRKKTAVLCLRSDLEGILTKEERKKIISSVKKKYRHIIKIDTQKLYLIGTENRKSELDEFFSTIQSADIFITDRLHGMVFCALANTPCIVFDNYNQKVKGIYDWISDLPYVKYKGTDTEISNELHNLSKLSDEELSYSNYSNLLPYYNDLANEIRKI